MHKKLAKTILAILLTAVLLLADGCCRRNQNPADRSGQNGPGASQQVGSDKTSGDVGKAVDRPVELLEKTGLNYSIDGGQVGKKAGAQLSNSFFEKQYLQGVELMEKGEYTKAIELFDELVKRYPNTEEASIAELCIAELYFRNKSNDRALQAYERIVANYPQSHAAENARAGIAYLKNFEKYEQEYISPDVEARKRRGY
jgi:TolA-binding protein